MRFALSASTIFLAAFLLFQVQPLIAGYILPWFGGSGAVWTTAMLFFQVVLVLGYAYAHWSISCLAPRTQAALHVSLLVAAVALLPIVPSPDWKPEASVDPTWRILLLLGATVGLPFLLLASTSPLLQAWLHRARPGVAPYRLYALGNAASLLALLSYPFVFEPLFSRQGRATFWSWGFGLFAAAGSLCALEAWRRARAAPDRSVEAPASALASASRSGLAPVAWTSRILLLLLPATASLLMLAITQQISQDVAPIPFLWVLPLGLYLFSFVLVFERDRWYRRSIFLGALVPAMGVALVLLFLAGKAPMWGQIAGWSLVLLVCCIACHGEVARLKPQPERLTGYYLTIACGGALGGVFAALVAPLVFDSFLELHVGLWLCCALGVAAVVCEDRASQRLRRWRFAWAPIAVGGLVLAVGLGLDVQRFRNEVVATARSFHGVLRVSHHWEDTPFEVVALYHGRTAHGLQWRERSRSRWPTLYYGPKSGAGLAFRHHQRDRQRVVGVVGLGIGTLAAYGRQGDRFRFYEIDPQVARLARSHFAHVTGSAASVEVIIGDARISLEREPSQAFDLLFLDAFSSDAIPAHLLTVEAFEIYDRHLKRDGVLAVHVSNAHLDLEPVVGSLARGLQMQALRIRNPADNNRGETGAIWMLLSRNRSFLANDAIRRAASPPSSADFGELAWTDDYANVLGALDLRVSFP